MAGAAPQWTKRLAIQLVRGLPGTRIVHRGTVRALGLRRRHQTVFRDNTPSICGMINQVSRLYPPTGLHAVSPPRVCEESAVLFREDVTEWIVSGFGI
jgi:ribosomal protein L30